MQTSLLLTFLFEHKRKEDEVVVQMDTNATPEVINVCERFENKPHNEYTLNQFTLNKNFQGPDHKASLDFFEFCLMCESLKNINKSARNIKNLKFNLITFTLTK